MPSTVLLPAVSSRPVRSNRSHRCGADLRRGHGRPGGTAAAGRAGVDGSANATNAVMASRRRKKSAQGQLEDELLQNKRWSGLREQRRLQALHHTPQQNVVDREACRQLVAEGYGSDVASDSRRAPGPTSAVIYGNFADLLIGMFGQLEILVDPPTSPKAPWVSVPCSRSTSPFVTLNRLLPCRTRSLPALVQMVPGECRTLGLFWLSRML